MHNDIGYFLPPVNEYFLKIKFFIKKIKFKKNKKNQKKVFFPKIEVFYNFVDAVMNTTIGNFKLFCQKYKKVVLTKKVDFSKIKIKKVVKQKRSFFLRSISENFLFFERMVFEKTKKRILAKMSRDEMPKRKNRLPPVYEQMC